MGTCYGIIWLLLVLVQDITDTRACNRFKEDLLNYELNQKFSLRRPFKKSYESARSSLKSSLFPLDFNHVCSVIENKALKTKERDSSKLEKKFGNLKRKFGIPKISNLNSDIIFNYSHRVLTEAEKTVLARGIRFCLPSKDVDEYDVKCSFELLCRDLGKLNVPMTNENQDLLRNQLKNISYNYIYSYDFSKQKNILSKDEWRALNDLRSDDSITITKPDKGNGIVIVSRLDYESCFLITPNSNHCHTIPLNLEKRAFLPTSTNYERMEPKFDNKIKNSLLPFLKDKRLKLKLRVFLAGHSVAMVTFCIMKMTPTYSLMIWQHGFRYHDCNINW